MGSEIVGKVVRASFRAHKLQYQAETCRTVVYETPQSSEELSSHQRYLIRVIAGNSKYITNLERPCRPRRVGGAACGLGDGAIRYQQYAMRGQSEGTTAVPFVISFLIYKLPQPCECEQRILSCRQQCSKPKSERRETPRVKRKISCVNIEPCGKEEADTSLKRTYL